MHARFYTTAARMLDCEGHHLTPCSLLPALKGVVEIFVFVQMGGRREAMIVKPLDAADANLYRSLAKFDAGKAQCFLERDREKLLAVIEASFGTFGPFNRTVRGYLAASGRSLGSSSSTATSTASLSLVSVEMWPMRFGWRTTSATSDPGPQPARVSASL
jgi:hypothetical protein